jgi:hypothetical protein
VLDRPIVSGRIWRTVNRDHKGFLQQLVNSKMIEIAAIIPFSKQRRAKPAKQLFQMTGHLFTAGD